MRAGARRLSLIAMTQRFVRTLLVGVFVGLALSASPASAEPANNLRELWLELGSCIRENVANEGWELTIVFSLKRSGELLGNPHISYARWPDDDDARRRIAANIARTMKECLPLSITDGLGGAIAGRPLAIRLTGRKKDMDT